MYRNATHTHYWLPYVRNTMKTKSSPHSFLHFQRHRPTIKIKHWNQNSKYNLKVAYTTAWFRFTLIPISFLVLAFTAQKELLKFSTDNHQRLFAVASMSRNTLLHFSADEEQTKAYLPPLLTLEKPLLAVCSSHFLQELFADFAVHWPILLSLSPARAKNPTWTPLLPGTLH